MGHIRLGRLPKTKPWIAVFDALAVPGIDAARLSAVTAKAAAQRFHAMKDDPTLQGAVWVLARLGSISKGGDFALHLRSLGIEPARASSGMGLVAEVARIVRQSVEGPSALGDVASKSAQKVLATRIVEQSRSLFGTTLEDVRAAVASVGTPNGFGYLMRDFFGDFAARTIKFIAEKELSNHVGARDAVRTVEDAAALTRDIDRYCRESAEIVREFAEGWYSKANWQTARRIDRERVESFLAYALTKLRAEIERGGKA